MTADLTSAPILSTPEAVDTFAVHSVIGAASRRNANGGGAPRPADDELFSTYEIARTADEILRGGWTGTVGLQFPDHMLRDAGWVVDALTRELETRSGKPERRAVPSEAPRATEEDHQPEKTQPAVAPPDFLPPPPVPLRLYVMADTSYSPCCVDEVAAEHVHAEAVVHYGRACLSPTARLPVVHVFTHHALDTGAAAAAFREQFPDTAEKVVVMADVTYQDHVDGVVAALRSELGYSAVLGTSVVRDPLGLVPNRRLANDSGAVEMDAAVLREEYSLFHVSTPPTALLLTLSSRFKTFHVFPTAEASSSSSSSSSPPPTPAATGALLRRRFARVLAASSAGIIGILVNTLSVSNYMAGLGALRARIAAAGKKSYTVVVGKINPAKLANFAEVEAWVVVGCWEGGLVDAHGGGGGGGSEYWRPMVTPFELEVALQREDERVWGGEWWGGIEGFKGGGDSEAAGGRPEGDGRDGVSPEDGGEVEGGVDGEESEPPEFDWRTGRLVSHSRPMRLAARARPAGGRGTTGDGAGGAAAQTASSGPLVRRTAAGEIATINGMASPGAEYLRSQRTWQGLGSDFHSEEASTAIEEGRSGIARGYRAGDEAERR